MMFEVPKDHSYFMFAVMMFAVMQSAPATATAVAISKREPDLARYVFSATNGEEE